MAPRKQAGSFFSFLIVTMDDSLEHITSGLGSGSPDRRLSMEVGIIDEVYPSEGECKVVTEKGRELEKVRVSVPMGSPDGFGLKMTPQTGARCLVAVYETGKNVSIRGDDAILLRTLKLQDNKGKSGDWGAPGDMKFDMNNGGEVLFSQGGLVDVQADPWTRTTFFPDDKRIKTKVKHHERVHSPLAHQRTIHDGGEGRAFHEFFLNSRFVHRRGDKVPNIGWVLGESQNSDRSSKYNPESDFLSWFKVEERDDQGGATHRLLKETGFNEGVIRRTTIEHLDNGVVYKQEIGDQDGMMCQDLLKTDELTIDLQTGDQENLFVQREVEKKEFKFKRQIKDTEGIFFNRKIEKKDVTFQRLIGPETEDSGEIDRKYIETSDSKYTDRNGLFGGVLRETNYKKGGEDKLTYTLEESGLFKIENPTWTIEVEEGEKATVDNGTTTITVDGDRVLVDTGGTELDIDASEIYVGGTGGGSEALAKGETLKKLLKQMKNWMNNHIHPHPHGPTSPPTPPFAAPIKILSKLNYCT